jgi:hypothetical protein
MSRTSLLLLLCLALSSAGFFLASPSSKLEWIAKIATIIFFALFMGAMFLPRRIKFDPVLR